MGRYVIDAWSWLEYLDGSEKGKAAAAKIEGGSAFTSIVTVAEVISAVARRGKNASAAYEFMASLSRVMAGNEIFAKEVGLLHSKMKQDRHNFGIADAFVLQTAKSLNAKVLTGDLDFEGLKEAEMLR